MTVAVNGTQLIGQVRVPVSVTPIQRHLNPATAQFVRQRREQTATLVVDRALTAEQLIVLTDLDESFGGNATATGDVFEERHHILRALGAPEGHQQDCLIGR